MEVKTKATDAVSLMPRDKERKTGRRGEGEQGKRCQRTKKTRGNSRQETGFFNERIQRGARKNARRMMTTVLLLVLALTGKSRLRRELKEIHRNARQAVAPFSEEVRKVNKKRTLAFLFPVVLTRNSPLVVF